MDAEPIEERRRYYNPALDPAQRAMNAEAGIPYTATMLCRPDDVHPANCVGSLLADDGTHEGFVEAHAPALDIDIPCQYVPSSTPGHGHLYFPTLRLSWERYEALLAALVEAGIVEEGYLAASRDRRQTILRLPHVRKTGDPQ